MPVLTGSELLDSVPGLQAVALAAQVHDFRRLPGWALGIDDVLQPGAGHPPGRHAGNQHRPVAA
jgi:hypothetical protein